MRLSIRNQLPGTVGAITTGGATACPKWTLGGFPLSANTCRCSSAGGETVVGRAVVSATFRA